VNWEDEVERDVALIFDNIAGPGWLYGFERHFWLDLWRVPVFEAVEECGIEVRQYGPIRGFVLAAEPRTTLLNLMLGVTAPGAVKEGHLGRALDWTESLGIDCRVPVRLDFGEVEPARDHLDVRGYRRTAKLVMHVRGGYPPEVVEPAGIGVDEITEQVEGFGDFFGAGYDMGWIGEGYLFGLPGRPDWRSYIAANEEGGVAAATMMMHHEVAQLGFAATLASNRGQGAHLALLHRRIADALAAGSRELFAVTEESLDYPSEVSAGARNLVRVGFGPVSIREVWRPPEGLVTVEGDDENEDDPEDDSDLLDDHDFELGF
jgi:hypothetical protein